jgi:hypothetical protein
MDGACRQHQGKNYHVSWRKIPACDGRGEITATRMLTHFLVQSGNMKLMKPIYFLSTISLFVAGLASQLSAQTPAKLVKPTPTERVALWPGKAPVGNGKFEECNLKLEVFLPPANKATGNAIVLCPGGGYIHHVTGREGYPIARWLNEHGIATIILEYRLPKLRHQVPLGASGVLNMMKRISVVGTMFVQISVTQILFAQIAADHEGIAVVTSAISSIDDYHRNAEKSDRVVRVVYFHPSDREPLDEWRDRLSRIIDDVSGFYGGGLRRFGINDRGIQFERSEDGYVFHLVRGQLTASEYSYESGGVIERELRNALAGKLAFDREHVLVIHGLCHREKDGRYIFNAPYYGRGTSQSGLCHAADCELLDPKLLKAKDRKIVYTEHYYPRQEQTVALFNTWYLGGIAHELGHGLGLPHDAGRPWERAHPATALMGSGNHHYREELWGGKRPAFLSLGSALRLLSHPLVTKSDRGRSADTNTTLQAVKFSSEGREMKLVGKIQSQVPAYSVITYLWRPPKWPGNPMNDHGSVSYPALVSEKKFDLKLNHLRSGNQRLRISVLHCNGAETNFDFHLKVDEEGTPNVAELNGDWLVATG